MAQQHSPEQLEQALRNFDRVGTLIEDQGNRQIWRFEFGGRRYFLNFYQRKRGNKALAEFLNLQAMQKAATPVTRPVAYLGGFLITAVKGDALIVEALNNAVPLDDFLNQQLTGSSRRDIARQVVQIIQSIGAAKFTHAQLTLKCFVVSDGKVYLSDARGMRRHDGFRMNDLFFFGHDAARLATRSELFRGWSKLNPEFFPPISNPQSRSLWKRFLRTTRRENNDFGLLQIGEWSGYFTKASRFAKPWSVASRLNVKRSDWEAAWPTLLAQLESGQLTPIKQDASGDVLSADLILAGRPISVIVKRPRRKYYYRYLIDLFRTARAERMWLKAWALISRNLPCEWPMIVMRRRTLGYTTDAVIIFERVPGQRLDEIALDALEPRRRDMLFRRAGRILRTIERGGLVHYDSKSTNWIVNDDPIHGATPVMIDVDGIRKMNYWLQGWSVLRLLRAMKNHPQYTPADSLALCRGFAPFARGDVQREES